MRETAQRVSVSHSHASLCCLDPGGSPLTTQRPSVPLPVHLSLPRDVPKVPICAQDETRVMTVLLTLRMFTLVCKKKYLSLEENSLILLRMGW